MARGEKPDEKMLREKKRRVFDRDLVRGQEVIKVEAFQIRKKGVN